jgi:hypothetical protein
VPRKLLIVVLCVGAIAAGWYLNRPRQHANKPFHRVAIHAPTPVPDLATETPMPVESPTPLTAPTQTPALAPSVAPAVPGESSGPRLALIVDDCGQWIDTERAFIALGVPITMSVLPDVRYTGTIAREASNAGMGVMLHLPMETLSGMNPGPGKITTEMSDDEIAAQVEADLAQVPLAKGVNNHEGSKASADERVMHDVAGVLAKHGDLFFIDSRTNAASVGEEQARAEGIPSAGRDVFLDNQATVAYTEGQLREAIAIAKRTGSAIAIGHPRPTTLEAVRDMIPEFAAQGIHLVLAQELVTPSEPPDRH